MKKFIMAHYLLFMVLGAVIVCVLAVPAIVYIDSMPRFCNSLSMFICSPHFYVAALVLTLAMSLASLICIHEKCRFRLWLFTCVFFGTFWFVFYTDKICDQYVTNLSIYLYFMAGAFLLLLYSLPKMLPQNEENGHQPILYGREEIYKAGLSRVMRMINNAKKGRTIAVFGTWGSGKTHFLRYLKREITMLDENKKESHIESPCVTFKQINLWQCHDLEDAWQSIIDGLYEAIKGRPENALQAIPQKIVSLLSKAEISIMGITGALDTLVNKRNDAGIEIAAESLSDTINYPNRAAVLVLDDIERADVQIVTALLPLLERLQKIRGLVVICAIARDELVLRFEEAGLSSKLLQGYMDKLFEQTICLPVIPTLFAAIEFKRHIENFHPQCSLLLQFSQKYIIPFDTPRQMIRVTERLASIEQDYFQSSRVDIDSASCVFFMEALRLLYLDFVQDKRFLQILTSLPSLIKKDILFSGEMDNVDEIEPDVDIDIYEKLGKVKAFDELIVEYAPSSRLLPAICKSFVNMVYNKLGGELIKAYYMSYAKNVTLSDSELYHIVSGVANAQFYSRIDSYLYSYCEFETNITNMKDSTINLLRVILLNSKQNENIAKLLYRVVRIEDSERGTCSKIILKSEFFTDLILNGVCAEKVKGIVKKYILQTLIYLSYKMPLKEMYYTLNTIVKFKKGDLKYINGNWYPEKFDNLSDIKNSKQVKTVCSLFARRIIQEYSEYSNSQLEEFGNTDVLRFFEIRSDCFESSVYENAYHKAYQSNMVALFDNYFKMLFKDEQKIYSNTVRLIEMMFLGEDAKSYWNKLNTSQRNKMRTIIDSTLKKIQQNHFPDNGKLLSIISRVRKYARAYSGDKAFRP